MHKFLNINYVMHMLEERIGIRLRNYMGIGSNIVAGSHGLFGVAAQL